MCNEFAIAEISWPETYFFLLCRCETEARAIYAVAKANPGIYSDTLEEPAKTYPSDNWQQYGLWAAAWMYSLTGEDAFKTVGAPYTTCHLVFQQDAIASGGIEH